MKTTTMSKDEKIVQLTPSPRFSTARDSALVSISVEASRALESSVCPTSECKSSLYLDRHSTSLSSRSQTSTHSDLLSPAALILALTSNTSSLASSIPKLRSNQCLKDDHRSCQRLQPQVIEQFVTKSSKDRQATLKL